jgi:hypothetical protein
VRGPSKASDAAGAGCLCGTTVVTFIFNSFTIIIFF